MKRLIIAFLSTVLIQSCQQNEEQITTLQNLEEFYSKFNKTVQVFQIPYVEDTVIITGNQGTLISLNPANAVQYGNGPAQPYNGEITLHLQEFYNRKDMVLNQLHTKLEKYGITYVLESKGMYKIQYFDSIGNNVEVPDYKLQTKPYDGEVQDMKLYISPTTNSGGLGETWQEYESYGPIGGNQTFIPEQCDSYLQALHCYGIAVQSFSDWLNCDILLDTASREVTIQAINIPHDYENTLIYGLLKDRNGALALYHSDNLTFSGRLPKYETVDILGIYIGVEGVRFAKLNGPLPQDSLLELEFIPSTEEEILDQLELYVSS